MFLLRGPSAPGGRRPGVVAAPGFRARRGVPEGAGARGRSASAATGKPLVDSGSARRAPGAADGRGVLYPPLSLRWSASPASRCRRRLQGAEVPGGTLHAALRGAARDGDHHECDESRGLPVPARRRRIPDGRDRAQGAVKISAAMNGKEAPVGCLPVKGRAGVPRVRRTRRPTLGGSRSNPDANSRSGRGKAAGRATRDFSGLPGSTRSPSLGKVVLVRWDERLRACSGRCPR